MSWYMQQTICLWHLGMSENGVFIGISYPSGKWFFSSSRQHEVPKSTGDESCSCSGSCLFFFADMILWKWYTQIMSLIFLFYIIYYIYNFIYDTCILRGAYHEMYLIVAGSWHVNLPAGSEINSACVLRGYPVAGSGLFPGNMFRWFAEYPTTVVIFTLAQQPMHFLRVRWASNSLRMFGYIQPWCSYYSHYSSSCGAVNHHIFHSLRPSIVLSPSLQVNRKTSF